MHMRVYKLKILYKGININIYIYNRIVESMLNPENCTGPKLLRFK